METLASPCSKPIIDKNIHKGFPCFKDVSLGRSEVCLLPSKKLVRIRFLHLVSVQHRRLQPVCSSSSLSPDSQVELETAKTRPEEENPSKTAYVKFQLQKKCSFGDHIFIVGDHPMFGLWDPENAVPLTWSEGHVWSLELDIPVGVPIQFKFILKTRTGNLVWQPGPDRVFKSWETEKKIIICEDWEEVEYQKLLEEEPSANQDGTVLDSEMALVAENLTPPKESDPLQALSEELVTGTSAPSLEKQLFMVAENISYSTEDLKANVNKGVPNYQKDEALATSNRNVLVSEGIGSVGRVETIQNPATADVEPNLVVYEGTPVLVPGLTPSATVSAEDEKNSTADALVEVSEAECHKLSELDEKQELEEEQLENNRIRNPQVAREEHAEPAPFQRNVLLSDIQWGHKTLQKVLTSLRILYP